MLHQPGFTLLQARHRGGEGEEAGGGGSEEERVAGEELGLEEKIPMLTYNWLSSDLSQHGHLVAQVRRSSNVLITTSWINRHIIQMLDASKRSFWMDLTQNIVLIK